MLHTNLRKFAWIFNLSTKCEPGNIVLQYWFWDCGSNDIHEHNSRLFNKVYEFDSIIIVAKYVYSATNVTIILIILIKL